MWLERQQTSGGKAWECARPSAERRRVTKGKETKKDKAPGLEQEMGSSSF